MPRRPRPRPYRKRERARQEEATRRRITEAAVELHGTLGPAKTSISEVARRAGVSRVTVYNHFPTETDLFVACSSHWGAEHPFPDPGPWRELADPSARLTRALQDVYRWYRDNREMLTHVFRDLPVVPAMRAAMERSWFAYLEEVVRILAADWEIAGRERVALDATLRLVLEFRTWESLTTAGLGTPAAAAWAARMVEGAVRPDTSLRSS